MSTVKVLVVVWAILSLPVAILVGKFIKAGQGGSLPMPPYADEPTVPLASPPRPRVELYDDEAQADQDRRAR